MLFGLNVHIVVAHAPIQPAQSEPNIVIAQQGLHDHPVMPQNHEEACNCFRYVKNRVGGFQRMIDVQPNTQAHVGSVSVEYYGELKHIALVTHVDDEGVFVEEGNFDRCKTGERFIPFDNPHLQGFWAAG